jgi:hypothetical protein
MSGWTSERYTVTVRLHTVQTAIEECRERFQPVSLWS